MWKCPSSKHGNQAATVPWRGSYLAGLVHLTEEQLPIHPNTSQEKFTVTDKLGPDEIYSP